MDAGTPYLQRDTPVIVGREREQEQLGDLLASACAGRGGLVLVSGEAGIGKTTLCGALCREAEDAGALVLTGGCYDLLTTPPYGPWLQILSAFERQPGMPDLPPLFRSPTALAQIQSQSELFIAVAQFIVAAAEVAPLTLVLEDLHWADQASLEFLRYLSRQLEDHSILVAATYRSDEDQTQHSLHRFVPLLVREARTERIDLGRLGGTELEVLVDRQYGLPVSDALRLAAYLLRLSDGNPLFARELLRTLELDGILRQTGDAWLLGELRPLQVPPLARQIIEQRLVRLGPEDHALLTTAAVIGQELPYELWQAISGAADDALWACIERSLAAHIVIDTDDNARLRFGHALVREALYQSVIPPRRRALHRRIAEQLAVGARPNPDTVAYHFQQAGDERAIDWLIQAGERAQRSFAWHTAVERFDAAQALLDGVTERANERGWLLLRFGMLLRFSDQTRSLLTLEQAATIAHATDDQALAALTRFYVGLVRHYLNFDGLTDLQAGIEAIEALDEHTLAPVRARIEQIGPGYLPGVFGLGDQRGTAVAVLAQIGKLQEGIEIGERFVNQVYAGTTDEHRAHTTCRDALTGLGLIYAMTGRANEALEMFSRAEQGYRAIGNQWVLRMILQQRLNLVILPYFTEHIRERRHMGTLILESWRQSIGVVSPEDEALIVADYGLAYVDGRWRDGAQAANICSSARWEAATRLAPVAIAARFDLAFGDADRFWERVALILPDGPSTAPGATYITTALSLQQLAAEQCVLAGELEQAHAWLEANERWLAWSEAHLFRAESRLCWARYYDAAGDHDRAHRLAAEGLRIASDPRQPLALIAAHRLLGELGTRRRDYTSAGDHLLSAAELAEHCQAPYELALVRLAQAELARATGDRPHARALLAQATQTCEELGARPAVDSANRLAATLDVASAAYPAGLTAREVEVLSLLVDGLSNREIADRLSVSHRTVMNHVSSILGKLGVASRTAAVTVALREGFILPR